MSTLSLRRGLLLRLGVLMLVFSALASVVVYRMALRFADEAYDEWLLDSARSLSQLVHLKDEHVTVDLPGSTLQAFVFDAHDRVLFRIDDARDGLVSGQPILHAQPFGVQDVRYADLWTEGQAMRSVQIIRRDLVGHLVSITVAETLNKRHRLASRVLGTVMALSGVLCLLTVLLARDAVARGLKPLLVLTESIRLRRQGDLTRLPDAGVAQELQTFTNAINDVLGQLDKASQMQRRFIADAAHQLRTPLAALKVELEHAVREPDPDRHAQALAQLRGGLDRLSRLANQLLTLARAEPGALARSHFKPLDLHALVHQAAMRCLPAFLEADMDLGFEGEAHPIVLGDALLLEEVINNLLDNARCYAGAQAQVTVRVERDADRALLSVDDNGQGVAPDELSRLTERFHRPAGSARGGSGLGLAIVQEIAETHGGHLSISSLEPHGLHVLISLPLLEEPTS
ncbi:MAG: sensor histidine kinase [Aquabacterium sp.]|uniref:sensor histidine kinase n=1 Tax=Aquabacterium sp. TaxID=1872578 RepID=UPI0012070521|nr:sensor histidine kinase [Aquabacterium sp.]TAK88722.1 MAG: sensor histidine kinase [Aquabacterium sp.]